VVAVAVQIHDIPEPLVLEVLEAVVLGQKAVRQLLAQQIPAVVVVELDITVLHPAQAAQASSSLKCQTLSMVNSLVV